MRIHYLQHVTFEGPGLIQTWADQQGHRLAGTMVSQPGTRLPSRDDYDVLIVLSGPMSVHDHLPWLQRERQFVQQAINDGKPVLGICLGAQLLAQLLGAKIFPCKDPEIGWYPIAFTDEILGHPLLNGLNPAMTVLHWHNEQFTLPPAAVRLAASAACATQGFIAKHGQVMGLQFHLEINDTTELITQTNLQAMASQPWVQSPDRVQQQKSLLYPLTHLLNNWLSLSA